MKFIHVSKYSMFGKGTTFNIGRNEKKRQIRAGKPRKQWPTLSEVYGYV